MSRRFSLSFELPDALCRADMAQAELARCLQRVQRALLLNGCDGAREGEIHALTGETIGWWSLTEDELVTR